MIVLRLQLIAGAEQAAVAEMQALCPCKQVLSGSGMHSNRRAEVHLCPFRQHLTLVTRAGIDYPRLPEYVVRHDQGTQGRNC